MSTPVPWNDARNRILAANLGVPIHWPNEAFQEPADTLTLWLAVEMDSHADHPIEIGATVWQEEGTLSVHVMAPIGTGTDAARILGKQVMDLFRHLASAPVIYLSSAIGSGAAADPRGLWWVTTVSIDWRYQDIA